MSASVGDGEGGVGAVTRLDDTLVLRPRIVAREDVRRPTRAVIDLDAVVRNYRVLTAHVRVPIAPVVKADAYGHGAVPIVRALARAGASLFCVALVEEALELRDAGLRADVLVLNGVMGGAHREVVQRGLVPVVSEPEDVESLARAAGGAEVRVHVKFDTGMARLGARGSSVQRLLDALARFPAVRVDGAMTHLAAAEVDDAGTTAQLDAFEQALVALRGAGHVPRLVHTANTAGALRHARARRDVVRVGLGVYGYAGFEGQDLPVLEPALALHSAVHAVRTVTEGEGVGYGPSFRATGETRIATVPIGYADGYFRTLSNRAEALVGGIRCPVVGNVSMDLLALDVTRVPGVARGAPVVLLGSDGPARVDADELARHAGTIPYEILTNVSRRVPRFYIDAGPENR